MTKSEFAKKIRLAILGPKTFAQELIKLRVAKKLTIPQLAALAKMPRQTLHLLENGQRQPSLETAERLAIALGKKLRAFEGCGVTQ